MSTCFESELVVIVVNAPCYTGPSLAVYNILYIKYIFELLRKQVIIKLCYVLLGKGKTLDVYCADISRGKTASEEIFKID